jgi:hypothetical protein
LKLRGLTSRVGSQPTAPLICPYSPRSVAPF